MGEILPFKRPDLLDRVQRIKPHLDLARAALEQAWGEFGGVDGARVTLTQLLALRDTKVEVLSLEAKLPQEVRHPFMTLAGTFDELKMATLTTPRGKTIFNEWLKGEIRRLTLLKITQQTMKERGETSGAGDIEETKRRITACEIGIRFLTGQA